jgi:hypothetical protein
VLFAAMQLGHSRSKKEQGVFGDGCLEVKRAFVVFTSNFFLDSTTYFNLFFFIFYFFFFL